MPHSCCHLTIPPSIAATPPPSSAPSSSAHFSSKLRAQSSSKPPRHFTSKIVPRYLLAVGFPFFPPPLLLVPTPLLSSSLLLSLSQPTNPVSLPSANSFQHLFGLISAANASLMLSSHHPCKPPPKLLFAAPKATTPSPANLLAAPTLCCPSATLHRIVHRILHHRTESLHHITSPNT
jgi:hypothetical protein